MSLSRQQRKFLADNLTRLLLIGGGIFMFIPLAWMVSTALKTDDVLANHPTRWWPGLPDRVVAGAIGFDKLWLTAGDLIQTELDNWDDTHNMEVVDRGARFDRIPDPADIGIKPREGEGCQIFAYDFREAGPGQDDEQAAIVQWRPETPLDFDDVLRLELWFRGDGSGHLLDMNIHTRNGNWRLSEPFHITFSGWQMLQTCFRREDRLGDIHLFVPDDPDLVPGRLDPLPMTITGIDFEFRRLSYPAVVWHRLLENFARIGAIIPLGLYFWNTLLVVFFVVAGQLLTACLAGYAFARLDFPGREPLFYLFLATMMVPTSVTMVPQFLLIHGVGLFDTLTAVIVTSLMTVWGTFLMRQFFKTLPVDLEDAARIDGCNPFQILFRVALPLAKPAVVTLGVSAFLVAWSMFQWPLIVTKTRATWTIQVGIAHLADTSGTGAIEFNLVMAAALVALLPQIVLFTLGQRAFREGIVLTGLKG